MDILRGAEQFNPSNYSEMRQNPLANHYHVAVCVLVNGERAGFVVTGKDERAAIKFAETFSNRIGYVGDGPNFAMAVKRAGMMERNEPNAWGTFDL